MKHLIIFLLLLATGLAKTTGEFGSNRLLKVLFKDTI